MNKMEKHMSKQNQGSAPATFAIGLMQPVLVTTEQRGVFFGFLMEEETNAAGKLRVKLSNARNCLFWSQSTHGFIGLATSGPNAQCRIGPAAPSIMLMNVTSITECTQEAVQAWENAPWSR